MFYPGDQDCRGRDGNLLILQKGERFVCGYQCGRGRSRRKLLLERAEICIPGR